MSNVLTLARRLAKMDKAERVLTSKVANSRTAGRIVTSACAI